MSASDSAKSRMERILRLHEQIDALKLDIRQVYAEEKAGGGDKTAMGAAVSYIRKRDKEGSDLADREAMADVYVAAYDAVGGDDQPHAHARAKEFQPPRAAGLTEIKAAYREGRPISQDFAYENGTVYLIAFYGLGRIKIGVSRDVERRIADLQQTVGDQAQIIATIPGNRQAEIAAHKHHASWCISGEWYRLCDEAVDAIKAYTHTHEREALEMEAVAEREAFIDQSGGIGAALSAVLGVEVEMVQAGELTDNQENQYGTDSGQHFGRSDDEQRDAARVPSSDGRGKGDDEGAQGQGSGVAGVDRSGGPVAGTVDREDEDGGSRHVGREARHEVVAQDDVGATASSTHSETAHKPAGNPVADNGDKGRGSFPAGGPTHSNSSDTLRSDKAETLPSSPEVSAANSDLRPRSQAAGSPASDAAPSEAGAKTAAASRSSPMTAREIDVTIPAFLRRTEGGYPKREAEGV